MRKVFLKTLCCTLAIIVLLSCCSVACFAGSYSIFNNGLHGISIDINAAPFSRYAQKSYGQYAYGPYGCAWYASARANLLSGIDTAIWSGASWWNSAYANYGFTRGYTARAGALACYENHVAYVEGVNGNNVIISEGGCSAFCSLDGSWNYPGASNGYCAIHITTVSDLESNAYGRGAFLGYVYVAVCPTKPSLNVTVVNGGVRLNWNACSNADYYDVRIFKEDGTQVLMEYGVFDVKYEYSLDPGTYFTYIAAVNYNTSVAFSDYIYFTVSETTVHKHSYGAWKIVNKATCENSGVQQRKCACGEVQTLTLKATGHSYSLITEREATCEAAGLVKDRCSRCGNVGSVENIPALGHVWIEMKREDATEESEGSITYRCENDESHVKVETIPKINVPVGEISVKFDSDTAVLRIGGTGPMKDYALPENNAESKKPYSPWHNGYTGKVVKTIIIEPGVTRIGENAFAGCYELKEMVIPASVTSIGVGAVETHSDVFTIYGVKGSCAEQLAAKLGAKFVVLSEEGVHPSFVDVTKGKWYYNAVDYATNTGLFNGIDSLHFAPNNAMTRAMLVSVLYRMENSPTTVGKITFFDVAEGRYYHDAVLWASQNGIVTGTSETRFAPDDTVTREQMAAILYRYAQYKGYNTTAIENLAVYPDAVNVSNYAIVALSWANAEDLITGTKSDEVVLLNPKGKATRAQVATILMRYQNNIVK